MIRTILFDLDGTLLPVHNDFFFSRYFAEIATVIPQREPKQVGGAILQTLRDVMREAEPTQTVASRFAEGLERHLQMPYGEQEPLYLQYYEQEFPKLGEAIEPLPFVRQALDAAKAKGLRTVLATNPVFPGIATRERMRWAGITEQDFDLITFYEQCSYTKPHTAYYTREVLEPLGLSAKECLMVGNDAREDMVPAHMLGMDTFFLTSFAIGAETTRCWDGEGDYGAMLEWILALPAVH